MTSARAEVLRRISSALGESPALVDVQRRYRRAGADSGDLELFMDRLGDYRASVTRTGLSLLPSCLSQILRRASSGSVLVPEGLPAAWLSELSPDVLTLHDETLTPDQLDAVDSVVTSCVLAIAETGTIILDHGLGQGRRAVTLIPDHHIVVVRAEQVVRGVVEAVAMLTADRPMTWVSGPSATSDIELSRVEGVHGPRRLDVVLVLPPAPASA